MKFGNSQNVKMLKDNMFKKRPQQTKQTNHVWIVKNQLTSAQSTSSKTTIRKSLFPSQT